MKPRQSAGVLLYRHLEGRELELLLVHMGGPLWSRREEGAWSIPKGEYGAGEDPLEAALREFAEELGRPLPLPAPELMALVPVQQSRGKTVLVFAAECDFPEGPVRSNTFEMEWPPHSGRVERFPEVDRSAWVPLSEASSKLVRGQEAALLDLVGRLGK